MSLIRLIAVAALLTIATAVPSYSQQHWLVGTWKGELGGISSSARYGTTRSLTIESVDGNSAKAKWVGPQITQTVTLTISGEDVSFSSPGSNGAVFKLTHKGNSLQGVWNENSSGKGGPIELKKQ